MILFYRASDVKSMIYSVNTKQRKNKSVCNNESRKNDKRFVLKVNDTPVGKIDYVNNNSKGSRIVWLVHRAHTDIEH
jgi:hypothetical protein